MYSKARIAGLPLHPMLVGFPIALFTATIALELAYLGARDVFYYRAAMVANVTGVVIALVAALPGAVDLIWLPRRTRARTTGNQHAMFNLLATAMFAVSGALLYIGWTQRVMVHGRYVLDATIPLAFDVVGFVSMVTAGALGYALVQTRHLGRGPELEALELDGLELDGLGDDAPPSDGAASLYHR